MSLTDPRLQTALKIRALLDCPGLNIYENKIKDLLLCEDVAIGRVLSKPIGDEETLELNEHLAQKRALEKVLLIKTELQEELEDQVTSPSEA